MCERYYVDFAVAGISVEDDALNGLFKVLSKFCINMHNFDMYLCVMIE